ncbi:MAG: hypothetical protein QM757_14520 [Paludibaculum sp.]
MPDPPNEDDLRHVWKDQPVEDYEVKLNLIVDHRTQQLYASTRSEIVVSIGAAIFFLAIMAWRIHTPPDRLQLLGYGLVFLWIAASLYWFRDRIWRRDQPPAESVAAPGLDYYRQELQRRRAHLMNAWLWHGPLFLACLVFVVSFAGRSFPNVERLRSVLPLGLLLALWTAAGFWRRFRQAQEIQKELRQLDAR